MFKNMCRVSVDTADVDDDNAEDCEVVAIEPVRIAIS